MEKTAADRILSEYTGKIFGFALARAGGIDEAEELAAQIALEAYAALRRADSVENPGGYIRRVAQNVYARYVDGRVRGRHLSLNESIPSPHDPAEDLLRGEEYEILRREIAYLGERQRSIVVMHYYDRFTLAEIAARLNIPVGTVKWHLHDAKNSLKEGMEMNRLKGTLGMAPIKFGSMGHSGNPGSMGDTADFLRSRLAQNITYAAYRQDRTVNEIAEELGVSPVFVEEEVSRLEEYGFMDKLPGDKYRTNIYITEDDEEKEEKEHLVKSKYAKILYEKYVPLVMDALSGLSSGGIYTPEGDANFLAWSAVTYACCYKLYAPGGGEWKDHDKYKVKRPDGGDYIASAQVEKNINLSYDPKLYNTCGNMNRWSDRYPIYAWQLNTCYDGRPGGWRDNVTQDYEALYEAYTGMITKDKANIGKFKRLYDKGYLIDIGGKDLVNMVVILKSNGDRLKESLPSMTDELIAASKELDGELYAIRKPCYPEHMQPLCKLWSSNLFTAGDMVARVLELCVAGGTLTLPAKDRAKGLTTILSADVLPK